MHFFPFLAHCVCGSHKSDFYHLKNHVFHTYLTATRPISIFVCKYILYMYNTIFIVSYLLVKSMILRRYILIYFFKNDFVFIALAQYILAFSGIDREIDSIAFLSDVNRYKNQIEPKIVVITNCYSNNAKWMSFF